MAEIGICCLVKLEYQPLQSVLYTSLPLKVESVIKRAGLPATILGKQLRYGTGEMEPFSISLTAFTAVRFTCRSLLFPGCLNHAGAAADPRTDRHAAPGAEAEHPYPQRADPEDSRGALKTSHTETNAHTYR